jgi:hypothetical protein
LGGSPQVAGGRENAPAVVLFTLALEVFPPEDSAGSVVVVIPPRVVAVWLLLTAESRLTGVARSLVVTLDSAGKAMLEILGVDGVEWEPEPLLLLNIMGGEILDKRYFTVQ